jgi:hypothetical protein
MNKTEVSIQRVNGTPVIAHGALKYCNLKYHKPYLAAISEHGDMLWQDKEYVGYGKHKEVFYSVGNLIAGDIVQAAGGSGGNKYPFKGRVVDKTDDTIVFEELSDQEFSNILAERKASKPAEVKAAEPLSESEKALVEVLKGISKDRLQIVLNEVK